MKPTTTKTEIKPEVKPEIKEQIKNKMEVEIKEWEKIEDVTVTITDITPICNKDKTTISRIEFETEEYGVVKYYPKIEREQEVMYKGIKGLSVYKDSVTIEELYNNEDFMKIYKHFMEKGEFTAKVNLTLHNREYDGEQIKEYMISAKNMLLFEIVE